MARKIVLTGMRTTGTLHLGHYVGALKEWKNVQDAGYECYFLLADFQAMTTHADRPETLTRSVREVVLDWLAVGLDPHLPNVNFVLQSQVYERYELSALFTMIAKYKEVMHNPTLRAELKTDSDPTLGFINYPVDQVADIYMVTPHPLEGGDEILVPVGKDQAPHLEYARDLARRFNREYKCNIFVPCTPKIGEVGRLVGTDGSDKMSKSKGNTIDLSDDAETVRRKVRGMYTDPTRLRATDPGHTRNNPVFQYHRAFNPNKAEVRELGRRYRAGKVGDVEVKTRLATVLNEFLDPIRERRAQHKDVGMRHILMEGTHKARLACRPVLEAMRERMHIVYPG